MSGPTKVRPVSSDFWKEPLNNGLSRSDHIFHVRKCFAQKAGALKRMKYLPVKTLQEIYFKTLFPSAPYCTCSGETAPRLGFLHKQQGATNITDNRQNGKDYWLPTRKYQPTTDMVPLSIQMVVFKNNRKFCLDLICAYRLGSMQFNKS